VAIELGGRRSGGDKIGPAAAGPDGVVVCSSLSRSLLRAPLKLPRSNCNRIAHRVGFCDRVLVA
jgi:hypothetical protein